MTRNCTNCKASYTTGKEYGGGWHQFSDMKLENEKWTVNKERNETKGICGFCHG